MPELPNMNLSSIGRTSVNTTDFVTILKSRSIHENIIKKLKLENYKEFLDEKEENSFQEVLERFQKKVNIISPSNKDSTIKIKVRLKNKELAIKIANLFFMELKDYLEKTNYLSTTKNRKFTEKQLSRISDELKKAEVRLLKFKEDNKTISLPDEINEYIKYLSELESQQLKSKIELKDISERIRVTSKSTSSFDQEWQNVIKEMEVTQAGLKSKELLLEEAKNKYFRLVNSLPIKALTLARLERELKVKNALYLMFTQQYEISKLEELKDLEPFKVLDPAYTSSKPVFPNKKIIIPIVIFISIIWSFLLSFFIEYWSKLKKEYSPSKNIY